MALKELARGLGLAAMPTPYHQINGPGHRDD